MGSESRNYPGLSVRLSMIVAEFICWSDINCQILSMRRKFDDFLIKTAITSMSPHQFFNHKLTEL